MKVRIKKFTVDMDVKSNGIEFEVRSPDDQRQIGDCFLTMTGLTWCVGRTGKAKGIHVKWADFIDICKSEESLKAAIRAAKGEE